MQTARSIAFVCPAPGVRRFAVKFRAAFIVLGIAMALSTAARTQITAHSTPVDSGQPPLPGWLQSGAIRFARFDGGPIETRKALRSDWASQFTPQDREILANLYGAHADRMIDLLVEARINFVWVTYSVGFSWHDEEAPAPCSKGTRQKTACTRNQGGCLRLRHLDLLGKPLQRRYQIREMDHGWKRWRPLQVFRRSRRHALCGRCR
jgi:hypothetical protein